jgi:hypothetical protein
MIANGVFPRSPVSSRPLSTARSLTALVSGRLAAGALHSLGHKFELCTIVHSRVLLPLAHLAPQPFSHTLNADWPVYPALGDVYGISWMTVCGRLA